MLPLGKLHSHNRTFVELKLVLNIQDIIDTSHNRTFVELKLRVSTSSSAS